jgi:hypothetical protein
MTASTISTGNKTTQFQTKVALEYVRKGKFEPYIGNDTNAIIQVNNNLKKLSLPLIAKLGGSGVRGSTALGGAEEALSNYDFAAQPTYKRNGVLIDNEEQELSEFDLFTEARPALMNWAMELKRNEIIQAMGAMQYGTTYGNYGGTVGAFGSIAATTAGTNTWLVANQDRVLYGDAIVNSVSGVHATALATIVTADKCNANHVRLLKRRAENADPLIRPVMIKGDEPWFVLFIGSYAFRDLQADLETLHSNGMPRDESNPLWSGGDLLLDGVVVKKIPEIDSLFIDGTAGDFGGKWGAGAASAGGLDNGGDGGGRVSQGFLCGAQAVAFINGRMPSFKRRKEDDYEHLSGVGVTCKSDIKGTMYNGLKHGIVTSFHASVGD